MFSRATITWSIGRRIPFKPLFTDTFFFVYFIISTPSRERLLLHLRNLQFRERKYPLHFDNLVADALWRANCHKSSGRRENRRYVKEGLKNRSNSHKHYFKFNGENLINDQAAADKNRKRHIRDWQQEEGRNRNQNHHNGGGHTEQRRGDIPVVSGDCDGEGF